MARKQVRETVLVTPAPSKPEPETEAQVKAEHPPKPPEPVKVFCLDCTHFRYSQGTARVGWPPLCAAEPFKNFVGSPMGFFPCAERNANGDCQLYQIRQGATPREGFWKWIFD